MRLQPGKDADGVARGGQGEFGHQHQSLRARHQYRLLDQQVAGQVDDRRLEIDPHFVLQLREGEAVMDDRRADRRFGGQDGELGRRLDHGAFQEQPVDPPRIVDGIDQPASRLPIERERGGAEMHVEVEDRGRPVEPLRHQPAERGRDGRGAHAAAHADDGDVARCLFGGRVHRARGVQDRSRLPDRVAQHVGVDRLEQIVVQPAGHQHAVQSHVVDLADRDDDRAGLAHFGQIVDLAGRVGRVAEIDQQDLRARADRQCLDRAAQPARRHHEVVARDPHSRCPDLAALVAR